MTRPAVLALSGVDAAYGRTEVLHGVDLLLHEGEVACLVGPSGCGKSTLLRCVAGFERISAGTIALKGRTVSGPGAHEAPDRRRVGVVFQDYALFPHLTVEENVGFGLVAQSRGTRAATVKKLLATIDLPGSGGRYPHELSGGQQQRVALARALAVEPDLLLLDEPFSNLDPELSKRMLQELRRLLRALGVTVLMVTHDHDEAFDVADVMGVMAKGRILQWGAPLELYRKPSSREVAEALGDGAFVPVDGGRQLLRPTDVELTPDGPLEAEVTGVAFRGTHFLYDLRLSEGAMLKSFVAARSQPLVVGARVRVRLVPTATVVFPD